MGKKAVGQAASFAGIGNAVTITSLKISAHALRNALLVFLAVFSALIVLPPFFATPVEKSIVKNYLFFSLLGNDSRARIIFSGADDQIIYVLAKTPYGVVDQFTPSQAKIILRSINPAYQKLVSYLWAAFGISFLSGVLLMYYFHRSGKRALDMQRIDGVQDLVSAGELNTAVRKSKTSGYTFVDVALPKTAPMLGILAIGSQGSGKTLAVKDLLEQVLKKGKKTIIFDLKGDLYRAFFRPGKDFFFNPAYVGSIPWSIFGELRYTYDADTMARSFLPPHSSTGSAGSAFFGDAARALFSVVLLRLAQKGAINTEDIAKAILEMPEEEFEQLVEKSVASAAISGAAAQQRAGVMASISIYLSGIASIAPGSWTVREFLERDDDSRLFIMGTSDTKGMMDPLFRLILTIAFQTIAAKQELCYEDKYWFFLDEAIQIGDIRLDDQLATLREYGVCIVGGVQVESQIRESMSKDRAATVMNCFNTVLALRCGEHEMRENIASRFGEQMVRKITQTQALAVTNFRDGASLNTSEEKRPLVFSSNLIELAELSGFLKIVGGLPTAKVNYSAWLRRPWFKKKSRLQELGPTLELPARDQRFLVISNAIEQKVDQIQRKADEMAKANLPEDQKVAPSSQDGEQKTILEQSDSHVAGLNAEHGRLF